MSSSVDTQTAQPGRHRLTSGGVSDEIAPTTIVEETVIPAYSHNNSRLSHLYGQCRDACADPAGLRIIATSALVVGLMLSSAPAALAQVRQLLATAPTTLTLDDPPTRDAPIRDDPALSTGDPDLNINTQHRPSIRSAMALIRWNGTRQALRCAYGLLFAGNTRNCTREPIVLASGHRALLA
jgi:hypothetical protein